MLFYLEGNWEEDSREIYHLLKHHPSLFFNDKQIGSLAGAAHLLQDNAGVLREAQWEQKSHVEQKGKSLFDFAIFSTNTNCESMAYRSFGSWR